MIDVEALHLRVGDRHLLDGVSFHVASGAFTCVLGPNGVGKTTLLRAMAGLRKDDGGTIRIEGANVAFLTPRQRAQRVAYVAADDALLDALTVRDVVAIGRYSHHRWWQWQSTAADDRAIELALEAVRMREFEYRQFETLSSGERQRVWIALSLAQAAPVLLLDEPTSHLDIRVAHEILGLLRELARAGKTVVCVLHDLNDAAAYADHLILLGCGTLLADGDPSAVLTTQNIERAYGTRMQTIQTPTGPRIFPA